MRDLCQNVEMKLVPSGQLVCAQGSKGGSAYIIFSGTCSVYRLRDPSDPSSKEDSMFKRELGAVTVPKRCADIASVVQELTALYKHAKAQQSLQILAEFAEEEATERRAARRQSAAGLTRPGRRKSVLKDVADAFIEGGASPRRPTPGSAVGRSRHRARRSSLAMPEVGVHSTATGESLAALLLGKEQQVHDRSLLGEMLVLLEEGTLMGELALFRADSRRAASIVSNGRVASSMAAVTAAATAAAKASAGSGSTSAAATGAGGSTILDCILVEIPHALLSRCMQATRSVPLPIRLQHLHRMHCLRLMIETDCVAISYALRTLRFKENEYIVRAGARSLHVYLVHRGRVVLRKPTRMVYENSVLKRHTSADLEVVTALGMVGDWEVVSNSDAHQYDAVATADTVVLAWPRETFELLVRPQVENPVVKDIAAAVCHQAYLREEWRSQRQRMTHTLQLKSAAMQTGAVPCARCGSASHVTTSLDCPRKHESPLLYDSSGHHQANKVPPSRRVSFFSSDMCMPAHMAAHGAVVKAATAVDAGTATVKGCTMALPPTKAKPATQHTSVDLSAFPSLARARQRCADVKDGLSDTVSSALLQKQVQAKKDKAAEKLELETHPGTDGFPCGGDAKARPTRHSIGDLDCKLMDLLNSAEVEGCHGGTTVRLHGGGGRRHSIAASAPPRDGDRAPLVPVRPKGSSSGCTVGVPTYTALKKAKHTPMRRRVRHLPRRQSSPERLQSTHLTAYLTAKAQAAATASRTLKQPTPPAPVEIRAPEPVG